MRLSLLLTLPFIGLALGDEFLQFGSGQLPTCAQSCTSLHQAQTACEPPAQQPKVCFCQSAYLVMLKTTPTGTCDTECPNASDRQQIMTWYNSYCNNAAAQPVQPSATNSIMQQASGTASLASSPTGDTSSTVGGTDISANKQSWWSKHAGWIAMVIVLVVAFALIIFGGVWWRKRHIRKRDAQIIPLPVGWGPNANPHDYAGPTSVVAGRKGPRVDAQPVREKKGMLGSGKMKKLVGRG